jgi:hypothetical protein
MNNCDNEALQLDGDGSDLTPAELLDSSLLNFFAECQAANSLHKDKLPNDANLDVMHDFRNFVETYQSVLSDAFHMMDRVQCVGKHSCFKSYYVALREAFFMWDLDILNKVKDALRKDGVTDDEIDTKMFYNVDWFRQRVPRLISPPSVLYWRVRIVFAIYG